MTETAPASQSFYVGGHRLQAARPAPGLYLVSTPIGNLGDITLRALETLAAADLVLCEDTRHSARLFTHYGISTPRSPLHEHNERARIDRLLSALGEQKVIALISDAGTPLLSDPGFPLVRAARAAGLDVFAVPGASALLAGLAASGLPTDSFTFFGFLPARAGPRRKAVASLKGRPETLVFYESPRRLAAVLADLAHHLGGDRPAAIGLELTKRFERFLSGPLDELARALEGGEQKGEAVILVAGARDDATEAGEDWQAALAEAMTTQPLRAAVDEIAAHYGVKRKEVYDAALRLKDRRSSET